MTNVAKEIVLGIWIIVIYEMLRVNIFFLLLRLH